MSNLTERAASERHAQTPASKAGRPSLQAKRGRTMALVAVVCDQSGRCTCSCACFLRMLSAPAADATASHAWCRGGQLHCTRTDRVGTQWKEFARRWQALAAVASPHPVHPLADGQPPTAQRNTGCMRGCGEGCLDGVTALAVGARCWTVPLVLGRAQCDCQPRYGLARPDALSSLQQGSRRHSVPSQSERREGLGVRARSG